MLRQSPGIDIGGGSCSDFCMVIDCQGEYSLLPIVDATKVTDFWVQKEKRSKQRGESNFKEIYKYHGIIEKAVWPDNNCVPKVAQRTGHFLNLDLIILKGDVLVSVLVFTVVQIAKFVQVFGLKSIFVDTYHLGFRKSRITSCHKKNCWEYLTYWILLSFGSSWGHLCHSSCWGTKCCDPCLAFFFVATYFSSYGLEFLVCFFLCNGKKRIFLLNWPLNLRGRNFIRQWLETVIWTIFARSRAEGGRCAGGASDLSHTEYVFEIWTVVIARIIRC